MIHLHSVNSFCEGLDDKILILLLPSPQVRFRIRVDNGPDIIHDILLLSALIVEGHLVRGQRLEDISYVEFWATSDTYMKIWYVKAVELLSQGEEHGREAMESQRCRNTHQGRPLSGILGVDLM